MNNLILGILLFAFGLANAQTTGASEIEVPSDLQARQQDVDDFDGKAEVLPDPSAPSPLEFKSKDAKDAEWIIAPVPNYSPSQEWGLALVSQYIFAHRADEKPSMFVGALFGTEKKSLGGMLGYKGHFNEDNLRFNVYGGHMKFNSDFYGVGKDQTELDFSVLLKQEISFLMLQFLPRFGHFYIGPTLGYNQTRNKFDIDGIPSNVNLSDKFDRTTWIPGIKLQGDTRDNIFYPKSGYLSNLAIQFFDARFGGDRTFQRYKGNYNHYFHLGNENVLATRFAIQANIGDVTFYDMATFGRGPDLRGYKAGKYRDKIDWAAQGEYRTRLTAHWGAVLFAGFGDVIAKMSDFALKDLLWSEGAGLRYRIGAQNPVDFRLDVAYGDEWAWYFSVNQAF